MKVVKPYKSSNLSKKEQVCFMFNTIADRYDKLNRIITFGIDILWRKKALELLKNENPQKIIDIATGTGDFAILAAKILKPKEIIGIDIADKMLKIGKEKIKTRNLNTIIRLEMGDSENIAYPDNYFDAAIVAYGVRNFENLEKGLKEIHRVLKKGGKFIILEATTPKNKVINFLFTLYFKKIVPIIGKLISKDKSAYQYLPESVSNFPQGNQFLTILTNSGYKNAQMLSLTMGASTIYFCYK
jgi:demethylmenaquinone methyltransferase/2-methoxy-6-polyprenyl-1,4-benzoquinol methylase